MIRDTTAQEDLKTKLAQEEIRKLQILNQKKKGSAISSAMKTGATTGKALWKAVEKM